MSDRVAIIEESLRDVCQNPSANSSPKNSRSSTITKLGSLFRPGRNRPTADLPKKTNFSLPADDHKSLDNSELGLRVKILKKKLADSSHISTLSRHSDNRIIDTHSVSSKSYSHTNAVPIIYGEAGRIEFALREEYRKLGEGDTSAKDRIAKLKRELKKAIAGDHKPSVETNHNSVKSNISDAQMKELINLVHTGEVSHMASFISKNGLECLSISDAAGWYPIHHATLVSNIKIVYTLVNDYSIDVNISSIGEGKTPLHIAVELENEDLISVLLVDLRADPNKADSSGHLPFDDCPEPIYEKFSRILGKNQIILTSSSGSPDDISLLLTEEGERRFSNMSISAQTNNFNWEIPSSALKMTKLLGRGSQGEVYQGSWRGATVAIKNVNWEKALQTEEKTRAFFHELDILIRLRHPNVVLFLGAFTKSRPYHIVLEFCGGGDLYSLLHERFNHQSDGEYSGELLRIGQLQKVKMAQDICGALYFLHSNNPSIVHKDLKSPNVLLNRPYDFTLKTYMPSLKITDFGISEKLVQTVEDIEASTDPKNAITRSNPVNISSSPNVFSPQASQMGQGTFLWMAPELIDTDMSNFLPDRIDMYSYGIVLYEIFAESLPFDTLEGKNPLAILINVHQGLRPDVERIPKDSIDGQYIELMKKCWSQDPSERPSAKEAWSMYFE